MWTFTDIIAGFIADTCKGQCTHIPKKFISTRRNGILFDVVTCVMAKLNLVEKLSLWTIESSHILIPNVEFSFLYTVIS